MDVMSSRSKLNLNGMSDVISSDRWGHDPFFRLRDLPSGGCENTSSAPSVKCVVVPPSKTGIVVISRYLSGRTSIDIPLYVVAPNDLRISIPTYGLLTRMSTIRNQ